MGEKSSAQGERFLKGLCNCVHVCSSFSPNCRTFAVEFDSNSQMFQNVQNLGALVKE